MKKILKILAVVIVVVLAYMHSPSKSIEKLQEKYPSKYSKFIPIQGMNAHYHDVGEGMPIILIHGTSSSLQTWGKWEAELSKKYRVLSIDMPGGGLTGPHPNEDYSIDAYLSFLDDFTMKLGLDSFYVAGNSLGGKTAWKYAARNKKIKKLILVDPSGFYVEDKKPPFVFQLGQKKALSRLVERLNIKPFIKKSLKEVYFDDSQVTASLVTRYNDFLRVKGNRKAFFQKVNSIQKSEEKELHQISIPTLIQWGKQDNWIPIELADIFTANIANHKFIVYNECGHVPQEEVAAESVTDAIMFLENKLSE